MQKKNRPRSSYVSKTILSSAPPGARTLDTLIKRKGFQSLFLLRFLLLFGGLRD